MLRISFFILSLSLFVYSEDDDNISLKWIEQLGVLCTNEGWLVPGFNFRLAIRTGVIMSTAMYDVIALASHIKDFNEMDPYLCHPDWEEFRFCSYSNDDSDSKKNLSWFNYIYDWWWCHPKKNTIQLALNYAAYRVLYLTFNSTSQRNALDSFMNQSLGIFPIVHSFDPETAIGIGNIIGRDAYNDRLNDGSNPLGINEGSKVINPLYSDWTDWKSTNPPMPEVGRAGNCSLIDRNHYQPLRVNYGFGPIVIDWGNEQFAVVRRFENCKIEFPVEQPYKLGTFQEQNYIDDWTLVLNEFSSLDDYKKSLATYFGIGQVENNESKWGASVYVQIAIDSSRKNNLNYIENTKLFFAFFNSLQDAFVSEQLNKRFYDYVRPTTAIQCLFTGQTILSWAGPYKGVQNIPGQNWTAWYPDFIVNNPSPEYPCGHCLAFGSSMTLLKNYFDTPLFQGKSVVIGEGKSFAEPKVTSGSNYIPGVTDIPNTGPFSIGYSPAQNITLSWTTWDDLIDSVGVSRVYLGAHSYHSVDVGTLHGKSIGELVWKKASKLFKGEEKISCKKIGEESQCIEKKKS